MVKVKGGAKPTGAMYYAPAPYGVTQATITVGAETGGNTINVAIQLSAHGSVFGYLSDNADGSTIAGTAPSGGIAVGTDGLAIPVVANKAFHLVSESDGDIDLDIVEASADTWYFVVVLSDGTLVISDAITFAA